MKTKIEELNISKIIDLFIFSSKQAWQAGDSRVWLWKLLFAYGYWLYELVIAGWQRNDIAVPYNLVFLFNVDPGFFLCNVGKICTMLAWHFQQPAIIKKFTVSKKKLPKSDVIQTTLHKKNPGSTLNKKTRLHGTFSCEMLSGVSWTTLPRLFTCAMLYQEY